MSATVAMGVDHGEARIGVAVSDALGMLAHPLTTVPATGTRKPEDVIAALAEEHRAEVVVLGLPLRMDGTEGTAAERVRAFGRQLRATLADRVRLEFIDERLSTVEAQRRMHAAGKDTRQSRKIIDQAAAAVILQDWLDQQAGPGAGLLPDEDGEDCG